MYTVGTDGPAQQQIDALPADALAAYAELRVVLETAPWSGQPYHRNNTHGAVRVHTFGTHGLAVCLILDDQRRIDVLLLSSGRADPPRSAPPAVWCARVG